MKKQSKVDDLLLRHLFGSLSPAHKKELDEWRSLSPENEKRFQEDGNWEKMRIHLIQMFESKERIYKKIMDGQRKAENG